MSPLHSRGPVRNSRRLVSCISLLLFSVSFVGCAIRQAPYSSNVESITNDLQKTFAQFLVPITLSGGSSSAEYPSYVQKSYGPIYRRELTEFVEKGMPSQRVTVGKESLQALLRSHEHFLNLS